MLARGCVYTFGIQARYILKFNLHGEEENVLKKRYQLGVNCKGNVTVQGNVESTRIKGNVVCNSLKCDKIEGDVVIK